MFFKITEYVFIDLLMHVECMRKRLLIRYVNLYIIFPLPDKIFTTVSFKWSP